MKAGDCPGYERDPRIPEWRGFHSARRGLASNLYRLGVPPLVIAKILRHKNVDITKEFYIKTTGADVLEGMEKLAEKLDSQTVAATSRTPNVTLGATPRLLN